MAAKTITAAQVRAWVLADPKRQESLSEAALANLTSRGRVHGEVVKVFNRKRRKDARYVEGGTKAAKAEAARVRAALRAQGHNVGTRGRLPKDLIKVAKGL